MPTKTTTPTSATENSLNRRQALGAVGAAAGAMALARDARAAPAATAVANNKCSVQVAAVSYTPPFHDHRAAGVNLQALRDMTAKVAKERPSGKGNWTSNGSRHLLRCGAGQRRG